MNRIEAEWLVAWALVKAKVRPAHAVVNECPINVGEEFLAQRCRRCSRKFVNLIAGCEFCLDCTYRFGGTIPEDDPEPLDLVDQFNRADSGRTAEAFQMMRIQWP